MKKELEICKDCVVGFDIYRGLEKYNGYVYSSELLFYNFENNNFFRPFICCPMCRQFCCFKIWYYTYV